MSSIGPSLPPHLLAKRKRQAEEEAAAASKDATAAVATSSKTDVPEKRQRIVGPALPPAPLDQMPSKPVDDGSDSSDDDYGPSMPTGDAANATYDDEDDIPNMTSSHTAEEPLEPTLKRDDWMTLPPTADGVAKNLDPTKLRPGKFRSGKSAAPASGGADSTWTETPEEKRKRLQDQVLGVGQQPSTKAASVETKSKQDEESARRIREYNAKHRGQSLYDQHQGGKKAMEEDDPSKRAFDREKDIGLGQLGKSQKKEMVNRAANFGSKFAGGKYL